jgi:probable blue pigment (indigoidine) exporter
VKTSKPATVSPGIATALSLLYVLLLSSAFVPIRVGVRFCPPLTLLTARFVVGGALMWGLARLLGSTWPASLRAWFRLVTIGILHILLPAVFTFLSLRHLSAGMAAIVMSANPLLLCSVAPWALGERLSPTRIAGIVLGFGGVVYVMSRRVVGGSVDAPLGVFLISMTVVSMVGATLLYKRFPPRESVIVVNTVQILVSATLLAGPAVLLEDPREAQVNLPLVAAFLYLVFAITIAATLLWFWLLRHGEASVASSYLFLSPLFGLMCAAVFLGERFTTSDAVGLLAVVTGIALIRRPVRRRAGIVS